LASRGEGGIAEVKQIHYEIFVKSSCVHSNTTAIPFKSSLNTKKAFEIDQKLLLGTSY
jgi:hypothetical protein